MDAVLTLRAEAMGARDGLLRRFGWYGLGALRPTPHLQLVARFDSWDRDLSDNDVLNNAFERSVVVGGSYALSNAPARFAINLVRQEFPNVTTPSRRGHFCWSRSKEPGNHRSLVALAARH